MHRDREVSPFLFPARYPGEGQALALRAVTITVARGPVPRDLSVHAAWRGTGPRPTMRTALCEEDGPPTVARGPVPREFPVDRSMARDRPSPYDEGPFCEEDGPPTVARGPVPRDLSARDNPG